MQRREAFEFIVQNVGVTKITPEKLAKFLDAKRGSELSGEALKQCTEYLRKFIYHLHLGWKKLTDIRSGV